MTTFRTLSWMLIGALALTAGCGSGGGPGEADGGSGMTITLQRVYPNLPGFAQTVAFLQAPANGSRWFVVQKTGQIMVFANTIAVSTAATFIDISGSITTSGEMGLLGMAFHPDFPADPRVYLSYTFTDTAAPTGFKSRISEFTTPDGGLTLDAGSERPIISIPQPNENNHKGGNIAFGPDGFLYIGLGDGGGSNDQHGIIGNAQDRRTLLGKMLRIDISGPAGIYPYRVPVGNLVLGNLNGSNFCSNVAAPTTDCPEIYALGFRNPWRWSFDRVTNELWVGDVGQGAREEVDRVTASGNYGWRCYEGTLLTGFGCGSPANPLPPVAEYGRNVGATVIGGYVYRGSSFPALVGRYVFGDFISGRIFNIPANTPPTTQLTGGFGSGLQITSFAQDVDEELYVVTYDGQLHRIRP